MNKNILFRSILTSFALSGVLITHAAIESGNTGSQDIGSGTSISSWAIIESGTTTQKNAIHVEAIPKGGTYKDVMLVTLKADDPKARIWYVTSPDASPGDALRYKKPIRITENTPIYFFAYTDENSESKIEKEEYTIIHTASGVSGSTGTVSSGTTTSTGVSSNIVSTLKKPSKQSEAAKAANAKLAGSGVVVSKNPPKAPNIVVNSGAQASSGTSIASTTGTTTSTGTPEPKQTVESLYRDQTTLGGSDIENALKNSKTSSIEGMNTETKTAVVVTLGLLLLIIAGIRVFSKKKI